MPSSVKKQTSKPKDSAAKIVRDLANARDYILTPVSEVKICVHCNAWEDDHREALIHGRGCLFARARALQRGKKKGVKP